MVNFTDIELGQLNKTERLIYELIKCCEAQAPTNNSEAPALATEVTLFKVVDNTALTADRLELIKSGLIENDISRLEQIRTALNSGSPENNNIYNLLKNHFAKPAQKGNSVNIEFLAANTLRIIPQDTICKCEVRNLTAANFTANIMQNTIVMPAGNSLCLFDLAENKNPSVRIQITTGPLMLITHSINIPAE
jgi:hypothetical protein